MKPISRLRWLTVVVLLAFFVQATAVYACSVPVFRYALERWPGDPYRVVIFTKGELPKDQKESLEKIKKKFEDFYVPPFFLGEIDVNKIPAEPKKKEAPKADAKKTDDATKAEEPPEVPEFIQKLWRERKDKTLPYTVFLGPAEWGETPPVWEGPLSKTAPLLGLSPKRHELAKRLLAGETAVWLLLKSGDEKKDKALKDRLTKLLAEAEKNLKLPHELDEEDAEYDSELSQVKLQIKFSILELDRTDAAEELLLGTFNKTSEQVKNAKAPIAVPVFGRGRALVVLPDEEVDEDSVMEVCAFLVGPCSCQVKAQNPGIDLLIPVNWDGMITGMIGVDEGLPPLSVPKPVPPKPVAAKKVEPKAPTAAKPIEAAAATAEPSKGLMGNLVYLVVALVAGVVVVSVVVLRRGGSQG